MPPTRAPFAAYSRVLIIAAHPDDETIGAGGLMQELLRDPVSVGIVHLTDGAPIDPALADMCAGARTAYADTRRSELNRALAHLSRSPEQVFLSFTDQELSFRLIELVAAIASLFDAWQPSLVITHPYEGGHPDHDSAALAVMIACALLSPPPLHFEFTSYHLHDGGMRTGRFLTDDATMLAVPLEDHQFATKQRMLASFESQQKTLRWFEPLQRVELFRPAPTYDFLRPPHAPPVFYDFFPWRIRSAEWTQRAAEVLAVLAGRSVACR